MAAPLAPRLMLSGPLRPPAPLPYRPPLPPTDGDWPNAAARHRHLLHQERRRRREPWTAASLRAAIATATERALAVQAATLDLLDAGRLHEDDPVRAAARLFDCIRLEPGLVLPVEWIDAAPPPVLAGPPRLTDRRQLRRRWQRAQAMAVKPVKLAILGPISFADGLADDVFGADRVRRSHALAEAMAPGLRDLADAGCPALEIVEPRLAASPAPEPTELEALARLLHRVDPEMQRWLRLVPADAVPPWSAAAIPPTELAPLGALLEDLPIDGVVLEAAPALDAIGRHGWRRLVVAPLVVADRAAGRDAVDQGAAWALAAAAGLEPHRLALAVDGGGGRAIVPLAERLQWLREVGAALRG